MGSPSPTEYDMQTEPRETHDKRVVRQYDAQAQAYLASAVHAAGADLDRMAERVGFRPDATALDMGCGGGHVTFRLAPRVGRVVACDLSATMLDTVSAEAARRGLCNVQTRQCAAESLQGDADAFDVVATRYSAHHWGDFAAGLRQMGRVARAGAIGLFVDVVTPGRSLLDTWLQSLELLRDPSHVRNASLEEWHAALAAAGFEVESVQRDRLRLEFGAWVARMRTPDVQVAAIRALQACAPREVHEAFEIEADGSFTVDTALIVACRR